MNEHVLQAIQDERDRQDAKWGSQRDLAQETWLTILVEEVGEVAESILEGDPVGYSKELVQVAAVAVAALEGYYAKDDPNRCCIDCGSITGSASRAKCLVCGPNR